MTLGVVEMLLGGVTSFVDMYYFENRCVETVEWQWVFTSPGVTSLPRQSNSRSPGCAARNSAAAVSDSVTSAMRLAVDAYPARKGAGGVPGGRHRQHRRV